MRENVGQGSVIGSVESVWCCHKSVNAVCYGAFRHSQAPLNMGGSVVNTRQYVAVEIDQFSFLSHYPFFGYLKYLAMILTRQVNSQTPSCRT